MEQKLKTVIGEYVFTIIALQTEIDQLKKQIEEYENKPQRKKVN